MLTYSLLVLQSISMKTEKTIGEMCEENKVHLYEKVYQEIKNSPSIACPIVGFASGNILVTA